MTLLKVSDLRKHFVARSGPLSSQTRVVKAVDGVSVHVAEGETLGLVGESGCGKSTLARCLLFLETPTSGEIVFRGERLTERDVSQLRRSAQIVFQDPYASLPPRMRVSSILADPLRIHGLASRGDARAQVKELLEDVGLPADAAAKYPHELSGGQRQRIGIARALSVRPSLIVADEAVSSLDVSVQAQILNLLKDLQRRHRLGYLFISHDLGVVKYVSHRIAVMYLGKIVETAHTQQLYERPLHPYTRALMSATPSPQRDGDRRIKLAGEPPDPANPPAGCTFHPRCPMAQPICEREAPPLKEWLPGRLAACHFALEDASEQTNSTPVADDGRAMEGEGQPLWHQ